MQLHFRRLGEGSPLIILHGLFGSSDNWQTAAKKFAENNFSVYLVDQRNHGRSPHSDDINYKLMSDDIFELMRDEKKESAAFIGHSMGGKTAMQFALDYPDKVSKLIAVDIAPKKYPVVHRDILNALLSIDLKHITTRGEAEKQVAQKIKDGETLQFLLKNLYWQETGKLAWRFNMEAINHHLDDMGAPVHENKTFNKPALFIRGAKSDYILKEDEVLIKKYFPLAIIKTAPSSGHWVHVDNPQYLIEESLKFLGTV